MHKIDVAFLGQHGLKRANAPPDVTEFAVIFRQNVLPAIAARCSWKLFRFTTNSRLSRINGFPKQLSEFSPRYSEIAYAHSSEAKRCRA